MRTKALFYRFVMFCLVYVAVQGQESESIGTQEVLVVKSYTPSLSDAFKINSSPVSPDSLLTKDKVLEFKIKSVLGLYSHI